VSEVKYLETNFDENISFHDGNIDIEKFNTEYVGENNQAP
jgi:hypothetical protein